MSNNDKKLVPKAAPSKPVEDNASVNTEVQKTESTKKVAPEKKAKKVKKELVVTVDGLSTENDQLTGDKHHDKIVHEHEKFLQKEEKWHKHPLHFHLFRFIFEFLLFVVLIAFMIFATKQFLNTDCDWASHSVLLITIQLLYIASFTIAIGLFTLALRRIFRVGRHQRMLKAVAKHDKHMLKIEEKFQNKLTK